MSNKYGLEAHELVEAMKKMVNDGCAIENFESYLSAHFDTWLERYANTPYELANEMSEFARINCSNY